MLNFDYQDQGNPNQMFTPNPLDFEISAFKTGPGASSFFR
jgi:hypothetical protein